MSRRRLKRKTLLTEPEAPARDKKSEPEAPARDKKSEPEAQARDKEFEPKRKRGIIERPEMMNQYLTFLTARRETLLDDMTAEESQVVEHHFNYVKDLLAKGRLILAGRCQNEPLGIVVFEAEDDEEANRLMHADPAVDAGIFDAEVHPYHVALLRGQ